MFWPYCKQKLFAEGDEPYINFENLLESVCSQSKCLMCGAIVYGIFLFRGISKISTDCK